MAAMEWPSVAASTWTFKQYPLLKALDAIHLAGVSEVELWAEGAHLDPRQPLPDLDAVGAALDRLGLWPVGLHAPFKGLDLTAADEAQRQAHIDVLKQALDVAAQLDAIHVIVHVDGAGEGAGNDAPGPGDDGARAQRLARAEAALRQLCEYSLDLGLTILIENQPDASGVRIGARVGELIDLIESVDMPNLGLCFDVAHAVVSTGAWQGEWRAAADHVAAVHMSDTAGARDDHLPLGAGAVDWAQFADAVDETGVDLHLVLEVAGGEKALQQSFEALDGAVAGDRPRARPTGGGGPGGKSP